MQPDHWLALTDYASKYRISVSTLRRRIKSGTISYRFEDGKYLIYDAPLTVHDSTHVQGSSSEPVQRRFFAAEPAPVQKPVASAHEPKSYHSEAESYQAPFVSSGSPPSSSPNSSGEDAGLSASSPGEEPIISSANRLLSELKRAYSSILQEKEEQIIQLKEEVSDLKTLVRALEEENERYRRYFSQFEQR